MLLLAFTDLLPESAKTQRMHTISAREAGDPFAVLQTINGPCPESVSVGCRKEFGMSIADRSIAATMATIPSVSPYTMKRLLLTRDVAVHSRPSRQVGCWLIEGTRCPLFGGIHVQLGEQDFSAYQLRWAKVARVVKAVYGLPKAAGLRSTGPLYAASRKESMGHMGQMEQDTEAKNEASRTSTAAASIRDQDWVKNVKVSRI